MNPLRQTSEVSFQTLYGKYGAASPMPQRANPGNGARLGRDMRSSAPTPQWRGAPEPAIAPFGVANDQGHPGFRGYRFGSGPAGAAQKKKARRAAKPVLYVGALGAAILAGSIAYVAVFASGDPTLDGSAATVAAVVTPAAGEANTADASSNRVANAVAVASNGAASGKIAVTGVLGARQNPDTVSAAVQPIAVKTIAVTPGSSGVDLAATDTPSAETGETVVANARWGYDGGAHAKTAVLAEKSVEQTAYASINAAATKPWPILTHGDVSQDKAAASTGQAEPKPAPVKSEPVAVEKAKYQDTVNDYVNMHSGPRSKAGVIMVVPKGATVGVVECKSWCKVAYDGHQGWIYNRYLGDRQAAAKSAANAPAATAAQADTAKADVRPKTLFEKSKENF